MIIFRHFSLRRGMGLLLTGLLVWSLAGSARAIILFRTGDPAANTTAPTGQLAGSGWQYQGKFGAFLGTPIAPHYFITAKHIGAVSDKFIYQGATYTIVKSFNDPSNDLTIFQVAETFTSFAPLYTKSDEVGQHLVMFGRGTQRGPDRIVNGQLRGWEWGAGDLVQRWGENEVSSIKLWRPGVEMLYVLFDLNGYPQEGHLSSGDSGGGVFMNDGGVWKLVGIESDVDRFASGPDGGGPYNAALFDERGSYRSDGSLVTGATPVPSGFYVVRISSRVSWIKSIISAGDPGLANISTRVLVGNGDRVCIGGFIIQGDPGLTKRIIIRGLGPSLEVGGVAIPGRISDPVLELHAATGATISSNDDWRGPQAIEIQNTGFAPGDEKEAALISILPPGNYTAVLRGANGSTGVGLIEVYDLDPEGSLRLLNLSARAFVGTNDDVLIGGLIDRGVTKRLLVRALGPELAAYGVSGWLQNPALELHDANGALIDANDDWIDSSNSAEIAQSGFAPSDIRESAIIVGSGAGTYTAIVRGVGETTGIALLEAYLIN